MNNYQTQLHHLIKEALIEDIGSGDYSTLCCIPFEQKGTAILKVKENCVIAGVAVAEAIFNQVEKNVVFIKYLNDGAIAKAGDIAFEIEASTQTLLKCERLVLNIMQRMSGIASLTKQYVSLISNYNTQILDTRKTTPNFRLLEKEAVRIGGGKNHRFGLFDMIMLKDNHIDFCGGIKKAIEFAWNFKKENKLNIKIEIETRNLTDVKEVCGNGIGKIDRIMLDNFSPEMIIEALKLVNKKFETEASGGINFENIISYAQSGVDFISVGALTHQAKSIDLSLKAK